MKTIVKVAEIDGEGLEGLLGQKVQLWCLNYFYTGILVGVTDADVKLEDASVVYETGGLSAEKWKDAQALPHAHYVRISMIESYSKVDKE